MQVTVKCIAEKGATLPSYQTTGSAGADLCAFVLNPIVIQPNERVLISTGLRFSIPSGFEVQIRPRSGLAYKHGITVLNSPGTIDSDYRGVLSILLINFGSEPFTVNNGDRIAQMVIAQTNSAFFQIVESLDETLRGEGGYGSTG